MMVRNKKLFVFGIITIFGGFFIAQIFGFLLDLYVSSIVDIQYYNNVNLSSGESFSSIRNIVNNEPVIININPETDKPQILIKVISRETNQIILEKLVTDKETFGIIDPDKAKNGYVGVPTEGLYEFIFTNIGLETTIFDLDINDHDRVEKQKTVYNYAVYVPKTIFYSGFISGFILIGFAFLKKSWRL